MPQLCADLFSSVKLITFLIEVRCTRIDIHQTTATTKNQSVFHWNQNTYAIETYVELILIAITTRRTNRNPIFVYIHTETGNDNLINVRVAKSIVEEKTKLI